MAPCLDQRRPRGVASANAINGLQTLVSRRSNLSEGMGVLSVGSIHGGKAGAHNPAFLVDEATLITGVRSHVEFVLGYADDAKQLAAQPAKK